jgi:hypothetical protein
MLAIIATVGRYKKGGLIYQEGSRRDQCARSPLHQDH